MKNRKKRILPGAALIALLAAVIVYCILINMEKNMLSAYEKGTVLVTRKEVMKGVIITPDNLDEYFTEKEMEKAMIPDKALSVGEGLYQRRIVSPIDSGVVLTESMTESLKEMEEGMKEPVVAGFMAEDLYQVVSGVLRSGDRIHIYMVGKDSENAVLLWENILVQEVFNSAGTAIPEEDKSTAAQRINVLMEKADIEEFYSKLAGGSLRVVKIRR